MQYIESSVIGIRSAVITLKHRITPLRFVLIPMVHVAEPEFFREVAELADEHDDRLEPAGGGPLGRLFESQLSGRDAQLVKALTAIHAGRQHEPVTIAVVFGALHIPAVVDCLTGKHGYRVASARWLTVARAS